MLCGLAELLRCSQSNTDIFSVMQSFFAIRVFMTTLCWRTYNDCHILYSTSVNQRVASSVYNWTWLFHLSTKAPHIIHRHVISVHRNLHDCCPIVSWSDAKSRTRTRLVHAHWWLRLLRLQTSLSTQRSHSDTFLRIDGISLLTYLISRLPAKSSFAVTRAVARVITVTWQSKTYPEVVEERRQQCCGPDYFRLLRPHGGSMSPSLACRSIKYLSYIILSLAAKYFMAN